MTITTTQVQARTEAKRLSAETGVIHVADMVRPSTRDGRWLRGGWPSRQSFWVVVNTRDNVIAWPNLDEDA